MVGWCVGPTDELAAATVTAAGRCGSAGAAGATLPPRRLRRRVVPVGRLSRHTAPVDRTDRQGCRRSRHCHRKSCWPPSASPLRPSLVARRSSARPTTPARLFARAPCFATCGRVLRAAGRPGTGGVVLPRRPGEAKPAGPGRVCQLPDPKNRATSTSRDLGVDIPCPVWLPWADWGTREADSDPTRNPTTLLPQHPRPGPFPSEPGPPEASSSQ